MPFHPAENISCINMLFTFKQESPAPAFLGYIRKPGLAFLQGDSSTSRHKSREGKQTLHFPSGNTQLPEIGATGSNRQACFPTDSWRVATPPKPPGAGNVLKRQASERQRVATCPPQTQVPSSRTRPYQAGLERPKTRELQKQREPDKPPALPPYLLSR